jgi:hypothetical protein
MPTDDLLPTPEANDLRRENSTLRSERDEYRRALYAVLWEGVTPPTADELASAEPLGTWFDELIGRLESSADKQNG